MGTVIEYITKLLMYFGLLLGIVLIVLSMVLAAKGEVCIPIAMFVVGIVYLAFCTWLLKKIK